MGVGRRPLVIPSGVKQELAGDALLLDEQATPATPAAGQIVVYPKVDHQLYAKDSTGAESPLGGGTSSFARTFLMMGA